MRLPLSERLLVAHHELLGLIAQGAPLHTALTRLAQAFEAEYPGSRCEIHRWDGHAIPLAGGPYWATPLYSGRGDLLGSMVVYGPEAENPSAGERLAREQTARLASIALERQWLSDRLAYSADHDGLTGLHNRTYLTRRLQELLGQAGAERGSVGLLLCDLTDFISLNEGLGYAVGDQILAAAARRLGGLIPPHNLARSGGHEFGILLDGAIDLAEGTRLAERILEAFASPLHLGETSLAVNLAIGVALSRPGDSPEELLRCAETAMLRARARGRGQVEAFTEQGRIAERERLLMETDLALALERNELRLLYQPIVSLRSGRIHSLEALIRWDHPERGRISPAHFIPMAEETGLIVPIGRWVIETACREMAAWHRAFPQSQPVHISINLSPRQFLHPHLVSDIAQALRSSGLDPSHLHLEITESVMIKDAESALRTLRQLQVMGVRFAIDDFGTGYSSLGYLKQLPVDVLKIDRSFLKDIGHDARDRGIIEAVMRMAQALGLQVVGEGIETSEQLEHLRLLGCDSGQGFHFAMPLEPAAVRELLRTQTIH